MFPNKKRKKDDTGWHFETAGYYFYFVIIILYIIIKGTGCAKRQENVTLLHVLAKARAT